MSFPAQYAGRCRKCREEIAEGDLIQSSDEHGGYIHEACEGATHPTRADEAREVCTDCFVLKPCGCDEF
ncbi:hypothetical protein MN032_10960 [Agromyces atrinae]|uniref:hypothetical protein n=1 Tax=Agromyces atrinae TaxID=592376 RepID=UPI001F5A51FB|nr:hypothetical protein [Agromyces atrinae]MCI2958217.1 hypothetical protein [Agromyces atrinae]